MSSHENKMHLFYMGSLSISFKAKSGVSHSPLLRTTTFSLDRSFRIFSPARITKLMETVDWPHKPTQVFPAHFDLTRAHSKKISKEVTHLKIAPHQARLSVEFLANGLP